MLLKVKNYFQRQQENSLICTGKINEVKTHKLIKYNIVVHSNALLHNIPLITLCRQRKEIAHLYS